MQSGALLFWKVSIIVRGSINFAYFIKKIQWNDINTLNTISSYLFPLLPNRLYNHFPFHLKLKYTFGLFPVAK